MDITIVHKPIDDVLLAQLAEAWHKTLVKGVADIERGVIALGGEWHMDANAVLIANGSAQQNVWGFNLYPEKKGDAAIEYISLINIRPAQGNRGMELQDETVRQVIKSLCKQYVSFLFV